MPAQQINIEYFFRLLYGLFHGGASIDTAQLQASLLHFWLWVTAIGYGVSALALGFVVFLTIRLFDLRKREEVYYKTLINGPEAAAAVNPRWQHIESLMEGRSPSEWREAITEADILLDDALTEKGYSGDSIGDKLKGARFATIHEAWEAHKVRNQIAHEGSAFELSETLARRTLAQYESVFRELRAI